MSEPSAEEVADKFIHEIFEKGRGEFYTHIVKDKFVEAINFERARSKERVKRLVKVLGDLFLAQNERIQVKYGIQRPEIGGWLWDYAEQALTQDRAEYPEDYK